MVEQTVPLAAYLDVLAGNWRLLRTMEQAVLGLDADQQLPLSRRLAYHRRLLEQAAEAFDLSIVSFDGQTFEAGLAATAINAGDFAADERLEVAQTLEPAFIGKDGVARIGTVSLRRGA